MESSCKTLCKTLQERLAALGGVMTDAAVPEGHAGLHGFLYGDGGAEAHDSAGYSFREVRVGARSISGGDSSLSRVTYPAVQTEQSRTICPRTGRVAESPVQARLSLR